MISGNMDVKERALRGVQTNNEGANERKGAQEKKRLEEGGTLERRQQS